MNAATKPNWLAEIQMDRSRESMAVARKLRRVRPRNDVHRMLEELHREEASLSLGAYNAFRGFPPE